MATGKVSAELTPEVLTEINGAIATMERLLPFLITLKSEERQRLLKLGPKSMGFLGSIVGLVKSRPKLVPEEIDTAEFLKDVNLVQGFDTFTPRLTSLAQAVSDTRTQAGSEAITTALVLYGIFKAAKAAVPGLNAVMKEIGGHFKKRSRSEGADEEPTEPTTDPS